jgi:hypothetical protein
VLDTLGRTTLAAWFWCAPRVFILAIFDIEQFDSWHAQPRSLMFHLLHLVALRMAVVLQPRWLWELR